MVLYSPYVSLITSSLLQVLQTLTYLNLLTTNEVTDGRRSVTITAQDADNATSNQIDAYIYVMDRNDGPAIDLGGGIDMDFMVTYIENGQSVAITIAHLLDLMDEEGHVILNMSIELVATSGILDPGDTIFLRTPMALPFLFDPQTVITPTFISVQRNTTPQEYIDILMSIRYSNSELEPTLFINDTGVYPNRVVIITVTDVNFESTVVRVGIEIQPVNDNAPVLFIDSDPAACSQDYRDEDVVISRSRRDVRFASKQRRKRMASGNIDTSWVSDSAVVDSCNKEVYNTTAEREGKKLCAVRHTQGFGHK